MKSSSSSSASDRLPLVMIALGLAAMTCCAAPLVAGALAAGTLSALIGGHQTLFGVLGAILVVVLSLAFWSHSRRSSAWAILCDAGKVAFRRPAVLRSTFLLTFVGAPLTVFYLVALPAERFGALAWGALQFLTAGDALAAVVLGFGVALSIALNLAAQRPRTAQTSLTLSGVLAALLPSSLCCTPLIPSALAALGASAPAVMHLSGRFQGFFAQYAAAFIAFAVAAVVFSLWLAAKNLVTGCTTCVPRRECETP